MERSAIIDECIALIAPDAPRETECRHMIECTIKLLCMHNTPDNEPLPLGMLSTVKDSEKNQRAFMLGKLKLKILQPAKADREALLRFAAALADAAAELRESSCWHYLFLQLPGFDASKFLNELEALVTAAVEAADRMHIKGGKRLNAFKLMTAVHAALLIEIFGAKSPTLTVGGPYYELASILYGAATGEPSADLSRHCKTWLASAKGRIEIS
jgi:hypothetical protein